MYDDFPSLIPLGTVCEHPASPSHNLVGLLVNRVDELPTVLFGYTLVRESFSFKKSSSWHDIFGKTSRRWSAKWTGKDRGDELILSWDIDAGWHLQYTWHGKSLTSAARFDLDFWSFFKVFADDLIELAESALANMDLPVAVLKRTEQSPVTVSLPDGIPMTFVISFHPAYAKEASEVFRGLNKRHFPAPVEGNLIRKFSTTRKYGENLPGDGDLLREMYAETGILYERIPMPDLQTGATIVYGCRYALSIDAPFFLMPEICRAFAQLVEKTPLGWKGTYLINTCTEHEWCCQLAYNTERGREVLLYEKVPESVRETQAKNSIRSVTSDEVDVALRKLNTAFLRDVREANEAFADKMSQKLNPSVWGANFDAPCAEFLLPRRSIEVSETPSAPATNTEAQKAPTPPPSSESTDSVGSSDLSDSAKSSNGSDSNDPFADFDWNPLGVPLQDIAAPFCRVRHEGPRLYVKSHNFSEETLIEVLSPDSETAPGVTALVRITTPTDEVFESIEAVAHRNSLAANGAIMGTEEKREKGEAHRHCISTCIPYLNEDAWLFQRLLAVHSVLLGDHAIRTLSAPAAGESSHWTGKDFAAAQKRMSARGYLFTNDETGLTGEIILSQDDFTSPFSFFGLPTTALLQLTATSHPRLGPGLCATLKMPNTFRSASQCAKAAAYLNALEMHGASRVEFYGAWCCAPGNNTMLAFVSFFENAFKSPGEDILTAVWPLRLEERAKWAYQALKDRAAAN